MSTMQFLVRLTTAAAYTYAFLLWYLFNIIVFVLQ